MGGTGVAVQIYDSDGKLKLAIHLASNKNWVTIRCRWSHCPVSTAAFIEIELKY